MKDQNSIPDGESPKEKYNRGLDIFWESVVKPDNQLRACAHNQKCFNELMEIREVIIEAVKQMPNPHTPKLKPGEKNKLPPVKSINGISVTLLGGALGEGYMKDWSEEHINEWKEYEKTLRK